MLCSMSLALFKMVKKIFDTSIFATTDYGKFYMILKALICDSINECVVLY